MKIKSSEVVMSSQHNFEIKDIQSKLEFESFIELDNPEKLPNATVTTEVPTVLNTDVNRVDPTQEILEQIMYKLINSLFLSSDNASMSREDITKEVDDTIGYSHLSHYTRYEEQESVSMDTTASIETDKGSLKLNINYSMSRSLVLEKQVDIYKQIDPLVISLDGDLPSLSDNTFSFDLDNDGKSDQISMLSKNNGFLALDKNEDGIINQGSELFGTQTGDGFFELSEYDDDKNGWIDENDPIFDKLQIWLKNDTDEKELIGLGEVGIGAIFLGSTKSEFSFKNDFNQTLGKMKESGFFLNEDFTTGIISQIDFSKQNIEKDSHLKELLT